MLRDLAAHHFGAADAVNPCGMADRVRESTA
jgi:hypothetical protein